MKITKIIPFLFPLLIVILGLIIYKGFEYKPNLYTIFFNVGLAYLLSPRIKYFETQLGRKKQVTWLFFKKSEIITE